MNYEKTEVIEFPFYVTKNLAKIIGGYSDTAAVIENAELMELFNTFATLEKTGTKGAVRYLLKTLEKRPIELTDFSTYKAYLITILRNNERSLTKS